MIYIILYKEESKGLNDPRGYIHDGPITAYINASVPKLVDCYLGKILS
jgi:hypothetical protein